MKQEFRVWCECRDPDSTQVQMILTRESEYNLYWRGTCHHCARTITITIKLT